MQLYSIYDACWGNIKSGQKLAFKERYIDVDLPDCDYGKIAESFGCYGEEVIDPNEINSAMKRAKNSGKPAVIDVKIKFETPDLVKLEWAGAKDFTE